MAIATWRLIINSITTTAFLTILGMPFADVAGVMLLFWIFLWLQGEVIESIVGRREERDRSTRTTSRGRRKVHELTDRARKLMEEPDFYDNGYAIKCTLEELGLWEDGHADNE